MTPGCGGASRAPADYQQRAVLDQRSRRPAADRPMLFVWPPPPPAPADLSAVPQSRRRDDAGVRAGHGRRIHA